MRNKAFSLLAMLFWLLATAGPIQAQQPEFAPPVSGLFGLVSPTNLSNGQIRLLLIDIDHDDTLEAFVRSATNAPPNYQPAIR